MHDVNTENADLGACTRPAPCTSCGEGLAYGWRRLGYTVCEACVAKTLTPAERAQIAAWDAL